VTYLRVSEITRRTLITFTTVQYLPKRTTPTFLRLRPGTIHPRWIVPDMLVVTALQFGHPVIFGVLVEVGDALIHQTLAPKNSPSHK
jgi:hypothetical protein